MRRLGIAMLPSLMLACGPSTATDGTASEGTAATTTGPTTAGGDTTRTAESSAASDGSAGSSTAPPEGRPCERSTPILQASDRGDVPTGLERCADGRIHAVAVVACELPAGVTGDCGGEGVVACQEDAECPGTHGFCNAYVRHCGFENGCECHDACASDADCDPGYACRCSGTTSECIRALCRTDADCDGSLCRLEATGLEGVSPVLACERSGADCVDADCDQGSVCRYVSEASAFECIPNPCS